MKNSEIISALVELQERHNIEIIYACESGSRAWGFASPDSDFDVRFIYIRPIEEYIKVNPKFRNVIDSFKNLNSTDYSEKHNLDLVGWDLKKVISLLYNNNPSLSEWFRSPIVYLEKTHKVEFLRNYAANDYQIEYLFNHYYHMALSNFRTYLTQDSVWLKKYLYVIRPILAIKWLLKHERTDVPIVFLELLQLVEDEDLKNEILKIVEIKKSSIESSYGNRSEKINEFLVNSLNEYETIIKKFKKTERDETNLDRLNDHFLKCVGFKE